MSVYVDRCRAIVVRPVRDVTVLARRLKAQERLFDVPKAVRFRRSRRGREVA